MQKWKPKLQMPWQTELIYQWQHHKEGIVLKPCEKENVIFLKFWINFQKLCLWPAQAQTTTENTTVSVLWFPFHICFSVKY